MDYQKGRATIVIPVYNQDKLFLRACIVSAMNQTWPDLEVIVIEDGSNPSQEDIIVPILDTAVRWREKNGFVHPIVSFRRQENGGVAAALNAAIELASGETISWLSSDDLYKPDRLSAVIEAMDGEAVGYCGWVEGVPQSLGEFWATQYASQETLFDQLKKHCFINACCVTWRRDVFDEVGSFDTNIVHAQVYEFILRCAERYNFTAVGQSLVRRRVHDGQMSKTLADPEEKLKKQQDMDYLKDRYEAVGYVWTPHEEVKTDTEKSDS